MELTAERLRSLFRYDPETGHFTRINQRAGRKPREGLGAGTKREDGYVVITVDGANYRAHRLAWLYMTGCWPRRTIDHRNGDKSDNRFKNLRDVSIRLNSQNQQNRKPRSEERPICIEVRQTKSGPRWRVRLSNFGKLVNVGTYRSKEDAVAACIEARESLHPGYIPRNSPGG